MIATRIACVALGVAVVLLASAWQLQDTASSDLAEARRLQSQRAGSDEGEPPKVSDNRAIVAVLEESIGIRRAIESDLVRIENAVDSLQDRQLSATRTTGQARDALAAIAEALGGSVEASSASSEGLDTLTVRLRTSARLAALIAEELEELDRKMGPNAGGPR